MQTDTERERETVATNLLKRTLLVFGFFYILHRDVLLMVFNSNGFSLFMAASSR